MHERSFLAGLELGKYIVRLQAVEQGLAAVKRDLAELKGRSRRFAILATLWTLAVVANVSTDRVADLTVELVTSALKR